jgi:predicted DNA-binding transcriptional regulator
MIVKATIKLELDDVQKDWVSYIKEQHGEKAVFYYLEEEVQKKIEVAEFVEMEYKNK